MKTIIYIIFVVISLFNYASAFECRVCHSKNPKMVRMHRALNFKDCFLCHKPGGIKKDKLNAQMISDERCIRCHK